MVVKEEVVFMLIHGFGGGPFELASLKAKIEKENNICYDLILPGHLDGKKGLRICTYKQWIECVEGVYNQIKVKHPTAKLIVVGFSMGGLLGAHLANTYEVDALVTLNTPIFYWNISNILKNICEGVQKRDGAFFKRYITSCTMYPTNALYQFRRLLGLTRPYFKNINCPILILQALDDDAVHYKSAEHIQDVVKSPVKKRIFMDVGGHGLLMGRGAEEAIQHVLDFADDLKVHWKNRETTV